MSARLFDFSTLRLLGLFDFVISSTLFLFQGEKVFQLAETEAGAVVEPDGIAADFKWKAVAVVVGCLVVHPSSVPAPA